MKRSPVNLLRSFIADRQGNVALTFALFSIPTTLVVGLAIDYGILNRATTQLQAAVDSAVLAGASMTGDREAIAQQSFYAMLGGMEGASTASVKLSQSGSTLKAIATLTVNTSVMKLAGIDTVTLTREASAAAGTSRIPGFRDRSCILGLGISKDTSHNAFFVQRGAGISLRGCELRSHASMDCDGADTGATAIYANGSATGCKNAQLNQPAIPDIYKDIAGNIERVCGNEDTGATWTASASLPASATVVPVIRSGYRELHICGPLAITGAGFLNRETPAEDLVIVVENGGLEIADDATIDARRMTFILAGGSGSAAIGLPNAADKMATLSLSPSTGPSNPWAGISLYQHPSIASGIDMHWKTGASIAMDGIAYFPNAKLTVAGALSSGPAGCSKLIGGELKIQGSINLRQSDDACGKTAMQQFNLPEKIAMSARLTR